MLRTAAAAAMLVASAEAFSTPTLSSLRMVEPQAQVSRKDLLSGAATVGVSIAVGAPLAAGAASFDPNTGFPKNDANRDKLCNGSADKGCQPMTQAASILDKQKAVLAGKITVAANKVPVLVAAIEKMNSGKKPKFDKDYVLRYSALYLSPLKDAMEQYALRDVNGAKAAGGLGLPKFNEKLAPASGSALYSYVESVNKGIEAVSSAAKAGKSEEVLAAAKAIQDAANGFLTAANPPVVFN
ncbi:hypothetical protein GUITHDRAFT_154573 [Guillardia theta CCMP2712]|uniref:Uncharacterized protein n=2 Tax=Guillardia theta TaxID=55529 RepID=L1ISK3_GUITC|nr:hypothetical protein GUITHDRAFT_154573 [Guillardia theta CCMP2712]EKX38874.1 hypothetical protein GUITHDRAFT_154573 [Guillardia theta CCMP2712]|eukprot:XP_005825854.1 hypothetical protein GUITHDRAFT_154573 [Guillardia theta CCMP2712]